MRTLVIILISAFAFQSSAQSLLRGTSEIGFTPFKVDATMETFHFSPNQKFMWGLYYNRFIGNSGLSWYSRFDYGENTVNDNCVNCVDQMSGQAAITEMILSTGFRYNFLMNSDSRLKPYFKAGIFASRMNYSATLQGGWTGEEFDHYNTTFMNVGYSAGLGVFTLFDNGISLGMATDLRRGPGTQQERFAESPSCHTTTAITFTELSIGYFFNPTK